MNRPVAWITPRGEEYMSAKPIPAKDVAASILKMLNDVTSEYPKEERNEVEVAILNSLSRAMFNGPVKKEKNNEQKN